MPIARDRILYEDEHLLAVNKLSGELVVKGSGTTEKLPLFDFLKKEYASLRALHRLDFETSGVIIFARTKEAYEKVMETKFADWKKFYRAILLERMDRKRGEIAKPLPARMSGKPIPSLTKYVVLRFFTHATYVEAEIETGRHHQIRKHFAEIGHPLVLDDLYGNKKLNRLFTQEFGYHRFFLHAVRTELPHPVTGEKIVVEAPLPKPFVDVLKRLL